MRSGDDVVLREGVHAVGALALESVEITGTGQHEAVVTAADEATTAVLVLSGKCTIENVVFWAKAPRASPLIIIQPDANVTFKNCRFVSITGAYAIEAVNAKVTFAETVFFETPSAIRFEHDVERKVDRAADLVIDRCEFLSTTNARGSFVHCEGPAKVFVRANFMGASQPATISGANAVLAVGCDISSNGMLEGFVVQDARQVIIGDVDISGSFAGAAVKVTAGEGSQSLELGNVRAIDASASGGDEGLITLKNIENINEAIVDRLDLIGRGGIGLLVSGSDASSSGSIVLTGSLISGWDTGIRAEGIDLEFAEKRGRRNTIRQNQVAIEAAGSRLSAKENSLVIRENVSGVLIEDGVAEFDGVVFERNADEAIRAGQRADIRLFNAQLVQNGAGLLVEEGAAGIELAGNTFDVTGVNQFAIVNNRNELIDASNNRWSINELPVHGAAAIDDLIADGDDDNPTGEGGIGEVRFSASFESGGSAIRWSQMASRRTPGYGNTVFRTREEVEARTNTSEIIEYGEGRYPLLGSTKNRAHYRGAGAGKTFLFQEEEGVAFDDFEALTLEGFTVETEDEKPAILWGTGAILLRRVELKAPAGNAFVSAGAGEAIEFEEVRIENNAGENAQHALLTVEGRSLRFDQLELRSSGGAGLLSWKSLGRNVEFLGAGLRARAQNPIPGDGVLLSGKINLSDSVIDGAVDTAVAIESDGTSTTARLDSIVMRGFTKAGVEVREGDYGRIELEKLTMTAAPARSARASGVILREGARARLMVNGLEGEGLRPGIVLQGVLTGAELRAVHVTLPSAYNDIYADEAGVVFELKPLGRIRDQYEEALQIHDAKISGYDVGILIAEKHDDSSTISLGNTWPDGANQITRNSMGVRLSSRQALVAMRENAYWSAYRDNGIAVLVERGALLMESAKVVDNQAGVIVRGGLADLGGGQLGSRGGNRLWPQSGALAVLNEGGWPLWAMNNDWGEAAARLATMASPAKGQLQSPNLGPIVTEATPLREGREEEEMKERRERGLVE